MLLQYWLYLNIEQSTNFEKLTLYFQQTTLLSCLLVNCFNSIVANICLQVNIEINRVHLKFAMFTNYVLKMMEIKLKILFINSTNGYFFFFKKCFIDTLYEYQFSFVHYGFLINV